MIWRHEDDWGRVLCDGPAEVVNGDEIQLTQPEAEALKDRGHDQCDLNPILGTSTLIQDI